MKLVKQNQGFAGGRVIGNAASVVVDEPLQLRRYVDRGRRGAGVGCPAICPDCDSYVNGIVYAVGTPGMAIDL